MKKALRIIITAALVAAWLYLAWTNRARVIEPAKSFAAVIETGSAESEVGYAEIESAFTETRDAITEGYKESMQQKYLFINLNGLFVKSTGGRVCNDVVKMDNGSLTTINEARDGAANGRKLVELHDKLADVGIDVYFVLAPYKINDDLMPYGLSDGTSDDIEGLFGAIEGKVPYLDLRGAIVDTGEHINEYFYKTDHHWSPLGAFKAFQEISAYLQEQYPEDAIVGDMQDLNNWNINRVENWFLGSNGKRTGTYFTGTDDLIWLTPKFDVEMSFSNPYREQYLYGDYYTANIREKYIKEKSYFNLNAYCVYIGGDYPLVQHRNADAPVDKKLLIIKDSFVLPLQTYLATVYKEVDVIDLRHYKAGTLHEYVMESRPDIVVMNLNGGSVGTEEHFDFGISDYAYLDAEELVATSAYREAIAKEDETYRCISLYSEVKAGRRYRVECDAVSVLQGEADGVSLKLYDRETKTVYLCSTWDLHYCEASGVYEWTFTAPADAESLEILVYAGLAGQTQGNGVAFTGIRVYEL